MCYHCGGMCGDYDFTDEEIYPERAKMTCAICGREVPIDEITDIYVLLKDQNRHVCPKCKDDMKICEDCGEVAHYEDMTEYIGGDGEVYWLCSNCIGGERIAELETMD